MLEHFGDRELPAQRGTRARKNQKECHELADRRVEHQAESQSKRRIGFHQLGIRDDARDDVGGLVLAGKLNEHLHQVDEECNQMMDRLMEQMKEKQGVTEKLKMQDQMAWVRRMNNIRACVEEIVVKKIVYA